MHRDQSYPPTQPDLLEDPRRERERSREESAQAVARGEPAATSALRSAAPESRSQGRATVRIGLLSAATQPRETQVYYEGLAHCYARFAADTAAEGRVNADRRAGLFFVMARDRGRILGGCGIHVRNGAGSLPVERALPDSEALRRKLDDKRWVAELSGLWVRDELRGSGVSLRLMQCAMAALPLLEVTVGVGFSHQHVLPLYGTIGLFPDPALSNFPYPNERYASSVLWADAVGLTGVDAENRTEILAARETFTLGRKVELRLEDAAARDRAQSAPLSLRQGAAR